MDLALNNLQLLICHKTKQNQTKQNIIFVLSSRYITYLLQQFDFYEIIKEVLFEKLVNELVYLTYFKLGYSWYYVVLKCRDLILGF